MTAPKFNKATRHSSVIIVIYIITHRFHVGLNARYFLEAEVVNLVRGHVGAGVVAEALLVQPLALAPPVHPACRPGGRQVVLLQEGGQADQGFLDADHGILRFGT